MSNFLDSIFSNLDKLSASSDEKIIKSQFVQILQNHFPGFIIQWADTNEFSDFIKIPVQTADKGFGNIIIKQGIPERDSIENIEKGAQIIALLLEKVHISKEKDNKINKELIKAKERAENNEAKSRGLLSAIPDMMFVFDDKGIIRDFHAENREDLYVPPELFLNKSVDETLPPHLAKLSREKIKKVLDSKDIEEYEYEITLNDQKHVYDSRMVYINPNQTLAIVRDITKTKQAEHELREREAILNSIIKNLPFDFWARNKDGVCFIQNEKSIKNWGNHLGKKIEDLDSSEKLSKIFQQNNLRALNGETINEELSHTGSEGKHYYYQNIIAPIKDNEDIIGVMGLNIDITERKERESELIQAKEKAEESDRLKSAFLANMSHEIRTPMNGIMGFTQLLKNDMFSPEEQREYLDVINLKSKQLLQIINNIIDISKIEASQIKVQYKSFSVNQLLKEVFEEYQIELKECKKEHIHLAIPDETLYKDIIIESDKSRLRQVLSNLISNAVKYTEEGNIEIGYIREHTQLKFYVKDTGIGISPDKLNVIFQRFRQAEDYSTRKYGGTGLGLSISKHLIELLGGTIWVDSKEHEGSCFYFTIPLHKAQTDSSQQAESENVTNATEKTYEKEYNWNGKNILIVEDDLGSLQLMQAVICRTNAHCIICKTGKEAIEKFNKYKDQVSIVLLDIQLPDLHGSEIIEYIKNKREDLPVIAQTAHAMDGDQTKYLSQGFDDYISKPIKATKLLTKINDFFINPTLHSD